MTTTQTPDTFTVATAEQAYILRQIDDASATAIREAKDAARKMLETAEQIATALRPLDFSSSHVARYQAALAKRDTLLDTFRLVGRDIPVEAVEAAAAGTGAWFTYPRD